MQTTGQAVAQLRKEGFKVTYSYAAYLLRERIVAPPAAKLGFGYVWEEADIQRLRSVLIRRGRGPAASGGVGA